MTLTKLKLQPGINKQTSNLGASGKYTDSDNIRFRYGLPEKIGGWDKTTANTLIGVVRDQHAWVALDGTRLAALGTCLLYTSPSPRDVEESRMPSSA